MWWNGLSVFEQIMFIIACVATGILLLQALMALFGGGESEGLFDADTSGLLDTDVDLGGAFDGMDDVLDGGSDGVIESGSSDVSRGGVSVFNFLTVKGILLFFMISGWASFLLANALDWWTALYIGVALGIVGMVILGLAERQLKKLESSGTLHMEGAVGEYADVYLKIPADGQGEGKISVRLQGRVVEAEAITFDKEDIKTGATVYIRAYKSGHFIVEKK